MLKMARKKKRRVKVTMTKKIQKMKTKMILKMGKMLISKEAQTK